MRSSSSTGLCKRRAAAIKGIINSNKIRAQVPALTCDHRTRGRYSSSDSSSSPPFHSALIRGAAVAAWTGNRVARRNKATGKPLVRWMLIAPTPQPQHFTQYLKWEDRSRASATGNSNHFLSARHNTKAHQIGAKGMEFRPVSPLCLHTTQTDREESPPNDLHDQRDDVKQLFGSQFRILAPHQFLLRRSTPA